MLTTFEPFNESLDVRRRRDSLTEGEITALLAATTNNQAQQRRELPAADRAMLYKVAIGTGFRASECASLTLESFHLDAVFPFIACRAGCTKSTIQDVEQAVARELAAKLRIWLTNKPTGHPDLPKRIAAPAENPIHS